MSLPHKYQVDFAKRKGSVPYPCYYCMHCTVDLEVETDEKNIVKNFGVVEEVPQICGAGIHAPTSYGDCKYAYLTELPDDYRSWFPSVLFEFFTKEYAMEMLTDINCAQYITKSMLIARSHKGYNTRVARLQEFIKDGIVDMSYDVKGEECYSLTDYGQSLADIVSEMLERYRLIKHHGELMAIEPVRQIFEFIREHNDCTTKQIYDYFDENYDYTEAVIPHFLEELERAGYVEPTYNDDYTRIGFSTSQKGILRWRAMYADNQV